MGKFSGDLARYTKKRASHSLYRRGIMTLETIGNTLNDEFAVAICDSCEDEYRAVSEKISKDNVGDFSILPNAFPVTGACSCGGIDAITYSAIEFNATVINEGLNDALKLKKGTALKCYKFALHINKHRAEPVYCCVVGTKDKWNYVVTHMAVIQFSTDRTKPPEVLIHDANPALKGPLLDCSDAMIKQVTDMLLKTLS